MFTVVPFKAAHLAAMKVQTAQIEATKWVTLEQAESLETSPSYTALVDGNPVCAAGVVPMWDSRAIAWALVAELGPMNFLKCHRAAKGFLDGCGIRRVEMSVDCGHRAAHRWARALGFRMEGVMPAYAPDGRSHALYARIT